MNDMPNELVYSNTMPAALVSCLLLISIRGQESARSKWGYLIADVLAPDLIQRPNSAVI
jgi:hypothetical protein